ncbi:unnamed protein product [marine sediment metagenome]|uniref:Pyruvate/ketoisovalerate oxidoreductase catalytic domain-containing protein n=1 Tax=marine sediment metagenome TaxID=412755 RepID=X1AQR5_9ZZZZ
MGGNLKDLIEVRWHGRGGQGAVTVSKMLAESALSEGYHVQAFPEYGAERMGAPVQAFTRISKEPIIIHSHVENPKIVLVLDPSLIVSIDILEGLDPDGTIIINSTQSPKEIRKTLDVGKRKVFTIDANTISLEELGRVIPNTPLLGAFSKTSGLVSLKNMEKAVKKQLSKKFPVSIVDANIKALRRGYEEVMGD